MRGMSGLRSALLTALMVASLPACDKLGLGDKEKDRKSKSARDDDDDDDSKKKKKKDKEKAGASAEVSAAPAAPNPLANFVKYTSPEGRYEIMLPMTPTEKALDGAPVTIQANANLDPKQGYTAQHTDYATVASTVDDKVKAAGTEAACGTITQKMSGSNERRSAIKVEGNDGCQVEFYTKEYGVIRLRVLWVGTRNYQLITSGVTRAVDSEAFFNSFKTTK